MKRYGKSLLIAPLLLLCSLGLSAEQIRGIYGDSLSAGTSAQFRLSQLLEIEQPDDELLESLDVSLTIPRSFLDYRDSFYISIYGNLNQQPDSSRRSYRGTLIHQQLLPLSGKLLIHIPFIEARQRRGPGRIDLPMTIDRDSFPLLIQIVPVMKGLPDRLQSADIQAALEVKLEDAGFLELELEGESPLSGENAQLKIDGEPLAAEAFPRLLKLPSGLHTLELSIDGYQSESRTFNLERGERKKLSLNPSPLKSSYRILAPEGTVVYLDGDQLSRSGEENSRGELEPGEHVVHFRFGDYQLSKKFTAKAGKTHKIELFFDILIEEH